jgi:hypothetical protein
MKRIEWLPIIWENTKNTDLAYIINEAISKGLLDKKYFINSKNQMAAESGGLTTPGATTSGISLPLILGGAAIIAFLIFKKSKTSKKK